MLFRLWAVPIATTVINVLTSYFFGFRSHTSAPRAER